MTVKLIHAPAFLLWGVSLAAAAGATPPQQAQDKPAAEDTRPNAIDRWNQMSPEERERELAKLPPARARVIRERIARYNQMPPDQKNEMRGRLEEFRELPPEKQEIVRQRRQELLKLPPERRRLVRSEFERIRLLPEPARRAEYKLPEFRSRFSPAEQQMIHDLSENLPARPK